MRKIKIYSIFLLLIFISLFLNLSNVLAEDVVCEYDKDNLVITYPESGGSPNIDRDNLRNSQAVSDVLDVVAPILTHVSVDLRNVNNADIDIDQDLMQEINDNCACPTNLYVCYYLNLDLQPARSTGVGALNLDTINELVNGNFVLVVSRFFSPVTVEQKLILYDEESYQNESYYHRYEGDWPLYPGTEIVNTMTDIYGWCYDELHLGEVVCGIMTTGVSVEVPVIYILGALRDGVSLINLRKFSCDIAQYNGSCDTIDVNCGTLENLKTSFINSINEYKSCGNDKNCKMNKSRDLDVIETRAKSYCGSVVKNYSYDELQSGCLNACFSLKKDLNDLKINTDLFHGITSNSGTCSVSDKIINWLSNIFRWGKFIAPALVIIMSMLDFIKAIASQSEDEMKKVQGKFVNRLIAAALVFLLPFILEFILRAFNLLSDNPYCGLI